MKNVLITGVGRGIGRAVAERFSGEGYFIIGTSQSGQIDYSLDNSKVYALDLTSAESIGKLVSDLRTAGTEIDILINNAGVLIDGDLTSVDIAKLRATLEVNLIGTIDLTERLLPFMNKESHIVNISSMAGSLNDTEPDTTSHHPYYYPAYKISKAAQNMYTRTLAMRLLHEHQGGMIVSAIHPGWVRTDMGGDNAAVTPEAAAEAIFKLATSRPETGQFWFNGKKCLW